MESNQRNSSKPVNRVKDLMVTAAVKLRSIRIPLSRLTAFLPWPKPSKARLLKAKYHHTETNHRRRRNKPAEKSSSSQGSPLAAYVQAVSPLLAAAKKRFISAIESFVSAIKRLIQNIIEISRQFRFADLMKSISPVITRFGAACRNAGTACKNAGVLLWQKCRHNRLTEKIRTVEWSKIQVPELAERFSAAGIRELWTKLPKFSFSQLPIPEHWQKHLNARTAVAGLSVVAFAGIIVGANLKVDAYALTVDGKKIAVITEKATAEKLIQDLKAEKTRIWKRKIDVKQKLSFDRLKAKRFEVDNPIALKKKLGKSLNFVAVATGIKVNGQVAVVVTDDRAAEKVLAQLKKVNNADDVKILSVAFKEKVELAPVPISLSEVLSDDKAVKTLLQGKQKLLTHVVKEGDNLWSIARKNDMHVADLLKANPSIKGERLDLGQEVNLVALEPMIHVMVTGERTVKEKIPYKVVVETNKSMWRGHRKTKTEGENGSRIVTYKLVMSNGDVLDKQVLNQKVLKEAKDEVVIKGTKYVLASRSGSGKLGWPLSGRLNSKFGRRWGRMHNGIDIDGNTGNPVGAAAAGVIVFTGREGGYGKMVSIRHSNGIVTRYGHLSRISVEEGQRVERGDLIGLVGSTGRSTGSHLHFEVIDGGGFKNPLRYLR